jgi:hypothetical protein
MKHIGEYAMAALLLGTVAGHRVDDPVMSLRIGIWTAVLSFLTVPLLKLYWEKLR